jgi:single-strand DNA-binding protein
MNKLLLIGRLGQDPILKKTTSGKSVVEISLATNSLKGKNSPPDWHKLVFWEKKADLINEYCHKGDQLGIEGSVFYDEWVDKDTEKKVRLAKVNVDKMEFLSKSQKSQTGHAPNQPVPAENQPAAVANQSEDTDFYNQNIPF